MDICREKWLLPFSFSHYFFLVGSVAAAHFFTKQKQGCPKSGCFWDTLIFIFAETG
jgi:hypothetical protein